MPMGLNNLSKINDWPSQSKAEIILTPHLGEMKRLWNGLIRTHLPTDRKEQAIQMANKTKTIIVLKGSGTVVSDGEKLFVNKTGNPGMATGGTGDVLTGNNSTGRPKVKQFLTPVLALCSRISR
jgi:NAD(P)H-hydrate epimerase